MQQTEKYWNLINRIVLVAIVIMAGVGMVLAFTPKVRQMQDYQSRKQAKERLLEETIAAENEFKEKIRRFSYDPEFVKKVAHEAGYACPDETIVHFVQEEAGNY